MKFNPGIGNGQKVADRERGNFILRSAAFLCVVGFQGFQCIVYLIYDRFSLT
jgi:hypothetical protein